METFLGRCCSALLERVVDVLSTIPRRIRHEFKIWQRNGRVLLADLSVSVSLLCQEKRMVYVFVQDKIRLAL